MMRLLSAAKKLIHDEREYIFYLAPEARPGQGEPTEEIRVCESYAQIPPPFRGVVLPKRFLNVMYWRLQRGQATLLCYSDDGDTLQAYGWIQAWKPLRRKFSMLAKDGIMLGPYWTAPEHRGKGLYGKLLDRSFALCRGKTPVFGCTAPENAPSQRGVAKAGFEPLGQWVVSTWFRWFIVQRKVDEEADR